MPELQTPVMPRYPFGAVSIRRAITIAKLVRRKGSLCREMPGSIYIKVDLRKDACLCERTIAKIQLDVNLELLPFADGDAIITGLR